MNKASLGSVPSLRLVCLTMTLAAPGAGCVTDTLPAMCVAQDASTGDDAGKADAGSVRDANKMSETGKADASKGADAASASDDAEKQAAEDSGEGPEDPVPVPDAGQAGACAEGYTTIGDTCACDLSGTFAFYGELAFEISGQAGVEDAHDTTKLWAIVQPSYTDDDKLTLSITDCGQATPDICGAGTSLLVDAEAYAQYTPGKTWKKGAESSAPKVEMNLPAALPGTAFVTPEFALLRGISLDDPAGAWPSSRRDVNGSSEFDGSAVNGARWLDEDDDGALGVSSYLVPPGGIAANGSASAPGERYGATSPVCPRGDPGAPRSPYAYAPVLQGITLRRIKSIQQATRLTAALNGRFESCDRVSGELQGPDDGAVRVELRVGGCTLADGSSESPCDAALLDLAEQSNALGLGLLGQPARFVMQRVADDITCAEVRKTEFE